MFLLLPPEVEVVGFPDSVFEWVFYCTALRSTKGKVKETETSVALFASVEEEETGVSKKRKQQDATKTTEKFTRFQPLSEKTVFMGNEALFSFILSSS